MKLKQPTRRPAFTLVEMLVATALIMFIMLILSEAFVAGLNAFRTLKGIGDAEERIRIAVTPLREDLRGDHFDGRRRLSDPLFWNIGNPREGFVNVTQGFYPVYSVNAIPAGPQTVTPVNSAGQNASVWSQNPSTPAWFTWTLLPRTTLANGIIIPGTILLVDPTGTPEFVEVLDVPTPTTFRANFTANHANAPITIRVVRQPEGVDADGLPLSRATDHILHLAVKLRGNRQENFFTAHLPGAFPSPPAPPPLLSPFFAMLPTNNPNPNYAPTTFFDQAVDARFQDPVPNTYLTGYKTQWAEIAYFLWPNGTFAANGTPLFALYRAEFKVVPDNRYINGQVNQLPAQPPPAPGLPPISSVPILFNGWNVDGYSEMSCRSVFFNNNPPSVYYFHTPTDLASINQATGTPNRVFTYQDFYVNQARGPFDGNNPTAVSNWSATLIATDVVSFDVQIAPSGPLATSELPWSQLPNPSNPAFPILPAGAQDFIDVPYGVFDTAIQPTPSQQSYTVNAIKITLRVFDLKTRQTRQVSIIQDM